MSVRQKYFLVSICQAVLTVRKQYSKKITKSLLSGNLQTSIIFLQLFQFETMYQTPSNFPTLRLIILIPGSLS